MKRPFLELLSNLAQSLHSMRARMTALFALFVALLMLLGGAGVQRREEWRAEKRTREILAVARERAQAELGDAAEKQKSLLQAVLSDKNEIAAGGLVLVVIENGKILWQSHRHAPRWQSQRPLLRRRLA